MPRASNSQSHVLFHARSSISSPLLPNSKRNTLLSKSKKNTNKKWQDRGQRQRHRKRWRIFPTITNWITNLMKILLCPTYLDIIITTYLVGHNKDCAVVRCSFFVISAANWMLVGDIVVPINMSAFRIATTRETPMASVSVSTWWRHQMETFSA